ncbi:MAG TPA: hypothetical protein VIM99_05675, partial [Blastocatellia bacterium]
MENTNISALSLAPSANGSVKTAVNGKPRGAELLVSGHLTVVDSRPNPIGSSERPAEFRVSGLLVNAATGYPLAGLKVKMLMELPGASEETRGGETAQGLECLLGDAVSDARGRFDIVFAETPLARQQLCLLQNCREATCYFKVESLTGKSYHVSSPMPGRTSSDLVIEVPLPLTLASGETWNALGKRLEEGRVAQLHSITEQLISVPAAQSLVGDWDVELRHSVAFELEQAFADPDGVLREIGPLPTFKSLRQPGAFDAYAESVLKKAGDPRAARALSVLRSKLVSFDDLF